MISRNDLPRRIIDNLERYNPLPGNDDAEKLTCRFLEAGIIDSFGLISLVFELEKEFSVRFDMDDLLSEEFQTVGGVVDVVSRMLADR